MNERSIRAVFDSDTITVYQAFNKFIAHSALEAQSFISPPFKKDRMTWIKPSFCWMMYRSTWATKENQEHILAIKMKRQGFEWAIENSCLSHFDNNLPYDYIEWQKRVKHFPVRIQWDPERDFLLRRLPYKTIQIGLSGCALEKYLSEWIIEIEEITSNCKIIKQLLEGNFVSTALDLIPTENVYPLQEALKLNLQIK